MNSFQQITAKVLHKTKTITKKIHEVFLSVRSYRPWSSYSNNDSSNVLSSISITKNKMYNKMYNKIKQLGITTIIIFIFSVSMTALALTFIGSDWASITQDIVEVKEELRGLKIEQCEEEKEMSKAYLEDNYSVGNLPSQSDIERWKMKSERNCDKLEIRYDVVFR